MAKNEMIEVLKRMAVSLSQLDDEDGTIWEELNLLECTGGDPTIKGDIRSIAKMMGELLKKAEADNGRPLVGGSTDQTLAAIHKTLRETKGHLAQQTAFLRAINESTARKNGADDCRAMDLRNDPLIAARKPGSPRPGPTLAQFRDQPSTAQAYVDDEAVFKRPFDSTTQMQRLDEAHGGTLSNWLRLASTCQCCDMTSGEVVRHCKGECGCRRCGDSYREFMGTLLHSEKDQVRRWTTEQQDGRFCRGE